MMNISSSFQMILYSYLNTNYVFHAVVVRGLEEKLFIATKERENLEDELESSLKKVKIKSCKNLFIDILPILNKNRF